MDKLLSLLKRYTVITVLLIAPPIYTLAASGESWGLLISLLIACIILCWIGIAEKRKMAVDEKPYHKVPSIGVIQKLLPLWILITVNVFPLAYIRATRGTRFQPQIHDMFETVVFFGFVIFDIAYLVVWAIIAAKRK